jgi:subtilase family serine protease
LDGDPPEQRQFLSRAEFAGRFGADPAYLDQVANFAKRHGRSVGLARRSLSDSRTVRQMEKAFGVTLQENTS